VRLLPLHDASTPRRSLCSMSGFARQVNPEPHLEQWRRVLRWRERLRGKRAQLNADPNDEMDVCLALFLNLYHLRDWILAADPTLDAALAEYVHTNRALCLAHDLCNGSKHMRLTSPKVDSEYLTAMEYDPQSEIAYRLVLLADGQKFELLALADECIELWRRFLEGRGMLPELTHNVPIRHGV
jgi:hypothetical protein